MKPGMPDENREIRETRDKSMSTKKPYAAPRLTAYGHISKLTAAGAGSKSDFPPGHKRKVCL